MYSYYLMITCGVFMISWFSWDLKTAIGISFVTAMMLIN